MAMLNAALAFAVTFLILSMSTSVLVETIHRCLGLREKGFRLMIGHFYDRVIGPLVESQGMNAKVLKETFVDAMTVNRAPAGVKGSVPEDALKTKDLSNNSPELDGKLLGRIWNGRRLDNLSTEDFVSRLGSGEFGGLIDELVKTESGLVNDIAAKFEEFGREATEFFGRRARLLSVLVAMAVAYLCYVNPFALASFYVNPTNATVTEQIANMAPDELKGFEAQTKALQDSADQLEQAKKIGDEKAIETAEAQLTAAEAGLQKKIGDLQANGVPIGWTEAQFKSANFGKFLDLIPYPLTRNGWVTVLWLLFGGLLIGLGGPFWFNLVKSLTNIRAIFAGKSDQTVSGAAAQSSNAQSPLPERSPADLFTDLSKIRQKQSSPDDNGAYAVG